MNDLTTRTVRDIALEMPLTTRIFEEYKIDYCCGGRVPFGDACRAAGVEPMTVLLKIDTLMKENSGSTSDAAELRPAPELIDHIIDKHHVFTRDEIDRLTPLMAKVCGKHGDHYPALFEMEKIFVDLAEELIPRMRKEEMVLFPYICQVHNAAEKGLPVAVPHFGTVNNPVRMMMFEHDRAGEMLRQLRELSDDYSAPEWACPSFRGLFAGLEALEKDLHQHIHLENNVLFPQAIELEEKILQREFV